MVGLLSTPRRCTGLFCEDLKHNYSTKTYKYCAYDLQLIGEASIAGTVQAPRDGEAWKEECI